MTTRKRMDPADDRPGSDRRDQLLAIAGRLIASRGYSATTVRDIADEAGILSGSLYHHFTSKDAILEEILRSFLGGLRQRYEEKAAAGGGPLSVLDALVGIAFVTIEDQPDAADLFQNEVSFLGALPGFEFVAEEAARIELIWQGVIQRGQGDGVFRPDLDPVMTYRFIRDAIWSSVRWLRPEGRHSIEGASHHFLELVHSGLLKSRASTTPGSRLTL